MHCVTSYRGLSPVAAITGRQELKVGAVMGPSPAQINVTEAFTRLITEGTSLPNVFATTLSGVAAARSLVGGSQKTRIT